MALNPVAYIEKVVSSFLRYQLTTYPFADPDLHAQMRRLLSLEETRRTPLLQGPFVSLSRSFRAGAAVRDLVADGVLHAGMASLAAYPRVYGHQERAIRAIQAGRTTLVSTGTGSGKTECFLYPIVSRCLTLRDEGAPPGIVAVIVYPMNALAEDQLLRMRDLLAGTGIPFGMYVGKTPDGESGVTGERSGASREDYRKRLARAQSERRPTAVHPAEERCSRESMREPSGAPRILLTNVNQLELLLTRQIDAGLFDASTLDYLVFDEAHTWTGAFGAETACLIRRLRSFCGRSAAQMICIATSATIADPGRGPEAGREFAARFFGVDAAGVEVVGEEYEDDEKIWAASRQVTTPPSDPVSLLTRVLHAVDAGDEAGDEVRQVVAALTGIEIPVEGWDAALHDQLASNEIVFQLAQLLGRPRGLWDLLDDLKLRIGRAVSAEEALAWLALGAAARKENRSLLRPVVHAFVRGVSGAVVTFPTPGERPRLWLSAEEEKQEGGGERSAQLPVTTCTTCGQHYFVHHVADFSFTESRPGGGQASGDGSSWAPLDPALGGKWVVLLDRLVSADDDDPDDPAHSAQVFLCRACGALHPSDGVRCLACATSQPLERLFAVQQKLDHPGSLTRCLSCGAPGATRGGGYREPARPVRAVTVSDVHVLAQDMVHHAERRRLLIFADNRQDAAFQAGWMRDHSRRFRLRALMAEQIERGPISVGDLAATLDEALERDDDLSASLAREVWDEHHKEREGIKHREKRKHFLRIQVLREITMGVKQRVGLEPWGRMRVDYAGLDASDAFVTAHASALGLEPERLAAGIASLLDRMRRTMHLLDGAGRIFSRF